jgi:hypothetical protein
MPTPELIALARAATTDHALDFTFSVSPVLYTGTALVCAIIEQESAWNPHAMRYEPGFRTRYVAPLGLPPSEEIARSISWGLMQIMGQVAREHGFTGKFLSALCDPTLGLDIGCAALASKVVEARAFRPATSHAPNQGFSPGRVGGNAGPSRGDSSRSGGSAGLQACEESSKSIEGFSPGPSPPQPIAKPQPPEQPGKGIVLTEIARALQLWNGGANPNYADEVLARLPHYE